MQLFNIVCKHALRAAAEATYVRFRVDLTFGNAVSCCVEEGHKINITALGS